MNYKNKLVVVAMSGGVDSSVTAAILLEKGYQVVGVTMHVGAIDNQQWVKQKTGQCLSGAAQDAKKVAKSLGIDYDVVNLKELFQKKVIHYFCQQYLKGQTPNPCVACNQQVKFGALMEYARNLGADYLATGHYARIEFDVHANRYALRKAQDAHKDQTYFLYTLTQAQLPRLLFPLGDYTKEQVRQKARDLGLDVAQKKGSQEICFIPDHDYRGFVRRNVGSQIKPGPFLDLQGNQVGEHQGIPYYTIGQRRGLGLSLGAKIYVVDIDPHRNAVIVGPEQALCKSSLTAIDINLVGADVLQTPQRVEAQIRYNGSPAPATLYPLGENQVRVDFDACQRAITPGQAVVFYRGEYVWGGGTIVAAGTE